jgi:hypothetical protein
LMFLDFDLAFVAPDGHTTVYKHWYNCVMLINHTSQNIQPVPFQFNPGLPFHFAWQNSLNQKFHFVLKI